MKYNTALAIHCDIAMTFVLGLRLLKDVQLWHFNVSVCSLVPGTPVSPLCQDLPHCTPCQQSFLVMCVNLQRNVLGNLYRTVRKNKTSAHFRNVKRHTFIIAHPKEFR